MRRDLRARGIRIALAGAVGAALVGLVGFAWFVVISWDVLRRAIGLVPLLLSLVVAAAVTATWASVLVSRALRPGRPIARQGRIGVAAVTLLAAVTGLVAVPATRARLESNKCRQLAAADAVSQAGCRTWLASRRQWWTLGLSHKNPAPR
jgi:Zn-dependent alcohol dehydrogenase